MMIDTHYPRYQWTGNYQARLWAWQKHWFANNLTASGNGGHRRKPKPNKKRILTR